MMRSVLNAYLDRAIRKEDAGRKAPIARDLSGVGKTIWRKRYDGRPWISKIRSVIHDARFTLLGW